MLHPTRLSTVSLLLSGQWSSQVERQLASVDGLAAHIRDTGQKCEAQVLTDQDVIMGLVQLRLQELPLAERKTIEH